MFQRSLWSLTVVGLVFSFTVAAPPEPIPQELAVGIAKRLTEHADKLPDPVFKIDADCEKATGLHDPGVAGLIVVPCKDIQPKTLKGAEETNGAPAGYLFLYKIVPQVDGKAVAADKLSMITFKDDNGNEREVTALRLAIKKENEDSYKLLVFSKDKKPLLASPFRMEANHSELPFSVSVKDVKEDEGTLVVTFFGKFAADVKLTKAQ
jgi:hypothetical protein